MCMKIDTHKLQQRLQTNEREGTINGGGTYISPNLIKESVTLDKDGNEIDWRTKQIIKRNGDK